MSNLDKENLFIKEDCKTDLSYGQLMIGIDIAIAYCPECGEMIQLSSWDELQILPDGSKGLECWCYNCKTDFYAKE